MWDATRLGETCDALLRIRGVFNYAMCKVFYLFILYVFLSYLWYVHRMVQARTFPVFRLWNPFIGVIVKFKKRGASLLSNLISYLHVVLLVTPTSHWTLQTPLKFRVIEPNHFLHIIPHLDGLFKFSVLEALVLCASSLLVLSPTICASSSSAELPWTAMRSGLVEDAIELRSHILFDVTKNRIMPDYSRLMRSVALLKKVSATPHPPRHERSKVRPLVQIS